ncbi:RDD family protein [Aquihabitans sp. McL0605]|uniref:RDD family protein n=1 Tax=Aquihabitans sp. McL0605 TaxID=3415671 RepID=UPI003CED6BE0
MSDTSQGPGWWQASDGKWYPPEQAPGAAPNPAAGMPPAGPPPGYGAPPAYGAAPAYGAPGGLAGVPGPRATWGQRAIAIIIDWAFIVVGYILLAIVVAILGAISDALGTLVGVLGYIALSLAWFYIAFLNGEGASPGKRLTGLKVVGIETNQPIGGGMGIVRGIAHILDSIICYIGWFFPLWDEKQQTIADKVMKTVVLTDQPKQDFSLDIFKPTPKA